MNVLEYTISNKYRSSTPKNFYDPVKHHTGIDIVCPTGTNLVLPFDVTFEKKLVQAEMGNTMYVKHGENIIVFAHLQLTSPFVKGDVIKSGVILGLSGNTGTATTSPHFHIELIAPRPEKGLEFMSRELAGYKGFNIDPTNYFKMESGKRWLAKHFPKFATIYSEQEAEFFRDYAKKILEWSKS